MSSLPASAGTFLRLVLASILATGLMAAEATVLRVSADSWMPFNGEPKAAKPGYVIELLKEIFEPQGIKVDYTLMPYTDALEATREGKIDAVIGPDEVEGKGLHLPKQSISKPCVVLLARADAKFEYSNLRSLRGNKLGVIEGYSYWDALNDYIGKGSDIVTANSEEPLGELITKLDKGEITVLAETEPVLLWYLREHKRDKAEFHAAYRHIADEIFVAFAPNEQGRALGDKFDRGMVELRKSGRLIKLLAAYGLKDWAGE